MTVETRVDRTVDVTSGRSEVGLPGLTTNDDDGRREGRGTRTVEEWNEDRAGVDKCPAASGVPMVEDLVTNEEGRALGELITITELLGLAELGVDDGTLTTTEDEAVLEPEE